MRQHGTHRRVFAVLPIGLVCACTLNGAARHLWVVARHGDGSQALKRAKVRLLAEGSNRCADPPEDKSVSYPRGGPHQGQWTNDGGAVRFLITPATCGPATLVVAKRGFHPQTRVVNTCERQTVHVALTPRSSVPRADNEATRIATRLLQALSRADWDTVDTMVDSASDMTFERGSRRPPLARRRFAAVAGVRAVSWRQLPDGQTAVIAEVDFDDGCTVRYEIIVVSTSRGARVRAILGKGHP